MNLFDHVAVAGGSEDTTPLVLRSVLEQFGLRVHLYRFCQRRNVELYASISAPRSPRRPIAH